MSLPSVDLAIIGGGCAGLSLARELARGLAGRQESISVMVLEPRVQYFDDRSWCFWAENDHQFTDLVSHRWNYWRFGKEGEAPITTGSSRYSYQHLRSIDFYRDAIAQCECSTHVELRLGVEVTAVEPDSQGWRLSTNQGDLVAAKVVDTRPPSPQRQDESLMFQSFLGVELRLAPPTYVDSQQLDLMTDMAADSKGSRFNYVLTFGVDHVLAEVTHFSRDPLSREDLEDDLEGLLKSRGWSEGAVVRSEYAVLPMGLPGNKESSSENLVRAGMGGGALRSASGYGFWRIQRWAQICAQAYCSTGKISSQPLPNWRQQRMDHLLLCVLRDQPERAPGLFQRLLTKCPPDRFVRFMDDSASWRDNLHVIAAMPKLLFLRAAVRYRRVT